MRIADIARGDLPAELVIKNARVANIFTQEYELADVAVYSGKIAGIGKYDGEVIHDAEETPAQPVAVVEETAENVEEAAAQ